MELEALIAIPVLTFVGTLTYLFLVSNRSQIKVNKHANKLTTARSIVGQYDVFKVLYAGVIIMIIMILAPWFIFYVRSGARLSFMTDYLSVLFILSMVIFPFTFFFLNKRDEGK